MYAADFIREGGDHGEENGTWLQDGSLRKHAGMYLKLHKHAGMYLKLQIVVNSACLESVHCEPEYEYGPC